MKRLLFASFGAALMSCAAPSSADGETVFGALAAGVRNPGGEGFRSGLRLRCEPSDATVYLDGIPRGVCTDFERKPARVGDDAKDQLHLVEVKKPGFSTYQTYYAPSGTIIALNVLLAPLAKSEGKSR